MAEKFAKQGKSSSELSDLLNYITRPEVDIKEIIEIYDAWADQYEQDLTMSRLSIHEVFADEVAAFYGRERGLRVLDVGAGTGRMGKAMYSKGFKNIDAIDASAQMLEKAKSLGVYENFYVDIIGPNKLSIPDNTYNLLISIGCFVPGHLKEDSFEEIIRVTKKGGHIYILTNGKHLKKHPEYTHNIETRMLELQDQGVWKRLERRIEDNYANSYQGVLFVLQKC